MRAIESGMPIEAESIRRALDAADVVGDFRSDGARRSRGKEEPGAEPVVGTTDDVLIPSAGDVLVYGDGGAGKTTLPVDLAVHLAAGDEWLGIPIAQPVRVLLVENEGPRPPFRTKLRRKRQGWTGNHVDDRLLVLDEPWADEPFANEMHRRELAQLIRRTDRRADRRAGDAVGHGRGGNAARGSRLPRTRRRCSQPVGTPAHGDAHPPPDQSRRGVGRVGGQRRHTPSRLGTRARPHPPLRAEGAMASSLHGTTFNLRWEDGASFTVEARPEINEDTMADGLRAAIREHPASRGRRSSDPERPRQRRRRAPASATASSRIGVLTNSPAREGEFNLWLADDPAAPRSGTRTGTERLPFPTPEADAEPTRSPVPALKGTGTGTERPTEANYRPKPDTHDSTEGIAR